MDALRKYEYNPDYEVSPGLTVKETMDDKGFAAKDFASRLDITEQSLHRIFKGEQPISYETANKLEMVTGTPARFWNSIEAIYREQVAKNSEKRLLSTQLDWLKKIPVKDLIERNIIQESTDRVELLRSVLCFFGVSTTEAWEREWTNQTVVARRSQCFNTNPEAAATWIRIGEVNAKSITCKQFSKQIFVRNLKKIRVMTKRAPEKFCKDMVALCAEAGVALTIVPEIKGVPWHGATKWLSANKAMIVLSLRGKSEDKFWFSFFHEAGHIILGHSKKELLINSDNDRSDIREKEADDYAASFLIPPQYRDQLENCRSHHDIEKLAKELCIAPGIVAGQYQYRTKKWSHYKDMIRPISRNLASC